MGCSCGPGGRFGGGGNPAREGEVFRFGDIGFTLMPGLQEKLASDLVTERLGPSGILSGVFTRCLTPLDDAIEQICCKIKAERELDIREEINKAIKALFGLITDDSIRNLVNGLPDGLDDFKKPIADFLAGLKADAQEAVEGGVPDFVLRFKPCPDKCGEAGECTVAGQKKFEIELKKKALAEPLKALLTKIIGEGTGAKFGKKLIDAIVGLVPVTALLIIQPIVDVVYNCKKKCVEKATLRMWIGMQGKAEGLGLTIKIGFGLDALVDLITGTLLRDAELKLGDGDVDQEGESGPVTYSGFFPSTIKKEVFGKEVEAPNPLKFLGFPEELFDRELDFLEGIGWEKAARKRSFDLGGKGDRLEALDLLTGCEE